MPAVATINARTMLDDDDWVKGCEGVREGIDATAVRHHLDALVLKLAEAQAGSMEAVRQSRRHAEAALALLPEGSCDHAKASGLREVGDHWMCDGCGATWPARAAGRRGRRGRHAHRDHVPVATVPDPAALDEPVNSL
jgi:hypothetical protein